MSALAASVCHSLPVTKSELWQLGQGCQLWLRRFFFLSLLPSFNQAFPGLSPSFPPVLHRLSTPCTVILHQLASHLVLLSFLHSVYPSLSLALPLITLLCRTMAVGRKVGERWGVWERWTVKNTPSSAREGVTAHNAWLTQSHGWEWNSLNYLFVEYERKNIVRDGQPIADSCWWSTNIRKIQNIEHVHSL